jgi:purine-binding chemotaxis protein CheW
MGEPAHDKIADRPEAADAGKARQYLSFNLGDELYGVEVGRVEVVLDEARVTRVPRAPYWLRGLINHRGSVVPIVDLKRKFDLGSHDLSRPCPVIVMQASYEGEAIVLGALADTVHEVLDIEPASFESLATFGAKLDSRFISGAAKLETGFLLVLDMDAALAQGDQGAVTSADA